MQSLVGCSRCSGNESKHNYDLNFNFVPCENVGR